jgi:hypothetical protein
LRPSPAASSADATAGAGEQGPFLGRGDALDQADPDGSGTCGAQA